MNDSRLDDPLALPFEFKQWLINYVQQEFTAPQILGLSSLIAVQMTHYFSAAGKTTVADSDFPSTPANGTVATHRDTTGNKTYVSVRANGAWTVIAGPL